MIGRDVPLTRPTVGTAAWRRVASRFDWPLFLLVIVISGIGLVNLYSATVATGHGRLFDKQVVAMMVGLTLYLAASVVDYRVLMRLAWVVLSVAIAMILAVKLTGDVIKGARRWLDFGVAQFQPSELAKLAVIIAIAKLAHDDAQVELPSTDMAVRVIAICTPIGLVVLQPDLGNASLLALMALSLGLLVVRTPLHLIAGVAFMLPALPLAWENMHEYQRQRVVAFMEPEAYESGVGWHTVQSITAVGSGRLTGKGYLEGTQGESKFLPEPWTDFPFSVWAEEWGFIGCLVVLALYIALILWCVHVAFKARDRFGTVICLGVAVLLFWQVYVNVAMVLGIAPVVGVTLPLISYGGSSVVTVLFGLGLVSSVSMRRHGY